MSLEDGIYAYLSSLPSLALQVAGRIYADTAPQDDPYPRVIYQIITDVPDGHMSGSSGIAEGNVQVDVYALDSVSRGLVGDIIKNGMDGLIGYTMGSLRVDSIFLRTRNRSLEKPDNNSDANIFRLRMGFSIWYREPKPSLS